MRVIRELYSIPNLALALGFFDGVHLAHQKLIHNTVEFAHKNNTKSAVITLKQQPYCLLNNVEPKYISAREDSYNIIQNLGIDYIIELDFNNISKMEPLEYLRDILFKNYSPIGIFTGFNHHFGLNRGGDCKFLSKYQEEFGYKYFQLPSQTLNNKLISSTAVRNFLETGHIEDANSMLGRKFCISGIVIEGSKIGRTINFPTANMNYSKNIVEIPKGVYSVHIGLQNGEELRGIANFGTKPTVSDSEIKILEAHIVDGFVGNLYGQKIKVFFNKFIRSEQKFNNINELKKQIKKDISYI